MIKCMNKWSNEWILNNVDSIFDQEFFRKVYNIINKDYNISHQDAEDLATEVIGEKIYKAFKNNNYRGNSEKEFWGYIHQIIKNTRNDYFKKNKVLPDPIAEVFSQYQDQVIHINFFKDAVEQYTIINEIIEVLAENLTTDQWEVLSYTAIGLNSTEISELINKSPAAVRKLRQRARDKAGDSLGFQSMSDL